MTPAYFVTGTAKRVAGRRRVRTLSSPQTDRVAGLGGWRTPPRLGPFRLAAEAGPSRDAVRSKRLRAATCLAEQGIRLVREFLVICLAINSLVQDTGVGHWGAVTRTEPRRGPLEEASSCDVCIRLLGKFLVICLAINSLVQDNT